MPKLLHSYSGYPDKFVARDFRYMPLNGQSTGNLVVSSPGSFEFKMEISVDSPVTITRVICRNATELNWRRTTGIIRKRGGSFILCRFVERGMVRTVTSEGSSDLGEGIIGITPGRTPYMSRSFPDGQGVHEAYQLYIPAHLLDHRFSGMGMGVAISSQTASGAAARVLVKTLFSLGEGLDPEVRNELIDALIRLLAACLKEGEAGEKEGMNATDNRTISIIRFISDHYMETDISATDVADRFGITRRYMSMLLARKGLNFTEMVQTARLHQAQALLVSPETGRLSIGEIAYRAGFRSSAYFSRAFKQGFGVSPRDFRDMHNAATSLGKGNDGAVGDRKSALVTMEGLC